jgi:hypothetical protein
VRFRFFLPKGLALRGPFFLATGALSNETSSASQKASLGRAERDDNVIGVLVHGVLISNGLVTLGMRAPFACGRQIGSEFV